MSWLVFSLFSALFNSFVNLMGKRMDSNPLKISLSLRLIPLFFLLPFAASATSLLISKNLELLLLVASVVDVAAIVLYWDAMKKLDVSLVTPITYMTPVFILIITSLFLGFSPSPSGIAGVVLVAAGGFFVVGGRFEHFKNAKIIEAVIVSFLWSLTYIMHKTGISMIGAYNWLFLALAGNSIGLGILVIATRAKIALHDIKLVIPGLFSGISLVFLYMALSEGNAAYVSAIRRTYVLIVIPMAYFLLRERKAKLRFLPAVLMLAGVLLISFA